MANQGEKRFLVVRGALYTSKPTHGLDGRWLGDDGASQAKMMKGV